MIQIDWSPSRRQLRQFAAAALPGFGLIGYAVLRATGSLELAGAIVAFGALAAVVGLAVPAAIRPLYLLLMVLTLPIGMVVSQVLLRAIFYGVLTPLGLLFRLFGRDPLSLRRAPGQASYWTAHAPRSDPQSYYRQA